MKNLSLKLFLSCFLIIVLAVCSAAAAFAETADISGSTGNSSVGKVSLSLQLELEKNLYFAKDNIDVYLDGVYLCRLEQGGRFQDTVLTDPGVHILHFFKANNYSERNITQFKIDSDSSFACTLQSKEISVSIRNQQLNHKEYIIDNLSVDDYKALCIDIPVEHAKKNPFAYLSVVTSVTGKVLSAQNYSDGIRLIAMEDSNGTEWFVFFGKESLQYVQIAPGDMISVYGQYDIGLLVNAPCIIPRFLEYVSSGEASPTSSDS